VDSSGNVYVSSYLLKSGVINAGISVFPSTANGDVAPAKVIIMTAPMRTISGSATMMSALGSLALDSAGNIYVLNDLNILKFSPTAMGNVAPTATISSMFSENSNIAVE
jgi:hypothetical protein